METQKLEAIQRLVKDAEELVEETKRMVEKGWERKSRLADAEEYLEHNRRMLQEQILEIATLV